MNRNQAVAKAIAAHRVIRGSRVVRGRNDQRSKPLIARQWTIFEVPYREASWHEISDSPKELLAGT